jgi:urate oxidase
VGAHGCGRAGARPRCAVHLHPPVPAFLSLTPCYNASLLLQPGYVLRSPETRLGFALGRRGGATSAGGGVRDWTVLKTTQSGYEGYLKDAMTMLPETRERILATSVCATWRYAVPPRPDSEAYARILAAMHAAFFGPAKGGVYSAGVQATLYDMACAALAAEQGIDVITLKAPNIHFLPTPPANIPFANDIYVATSEPHGTIQATVARKQGNTVPIARL